jgi:hypothetical protein
MTPSTAPRSTTTPAPWRAAIAEARKNFKRRKRRKTPEQIAADVAARKAREAARKRRAYLAAAAAKGRTVRKPGRPATVAHLTDDQRRARSSEMRKERRRMKAEAEGREIKTRANLKSMTAEEKKAHQSAKRKENRQRPKEETTSKQHPLFGRFS